MMMSDNLYYFLDTSSQIARHWTDKHTKETVQSDLSGNKLRCSIYVEREYRCKILNSLIVIYSIVKQSKSLDDSLADAENRLDKLRKDGVLEEFIYKIGKRLLRKYNSQKPLLKYLGKLIEVDWENYFYDRVPRSLCDMTGCSRGADAPEYKGDYYLSIEQKCPTNCKIQDFWKSKEADLKNLAQTVTVDAKGTMQAIRTEAEAVLSGKDPHDNPCRVLSDAVISIEARDGYPGITIHTMDADFEHLRPVLKTQIRHLKV
jgi:DNA-binding Lrp family transcriptional regulator